MRNLLFTGLAASFIARAPASTQPQGFDPAPVNAVLSEMVESGQLPGASVLIYRGGEELYFSAAGYADIAAQKPITRETEFTIFSMTKPVTGTVFGLNFAVRLAPPVDADEPYGVTGEFFWDGAASTLFWVDPQNDVTVVFMTQVRPFDGNAHARMRKAVYQGLGLYTLGAE